MTPPSNILRTKSKKSPRNTGTVIGKIHSVHSGLHPQFWFRIYSRSQCSVSRRPCKSIPCLPPSRLSLPSPVWSFMAHSSVKIVTRCPYKKHNLGTWACCCCCPRFLLKEERKNANPCWSATLVGDDLSDDKLGDHAGEVNDVLREHAKALCSRMDTLSAVQPQSIESWAALSLTGQAVRVHTKNAQTLIESGEFGLLFVPSPVTLDMF